jgi:hypothetical protein
MCAPPPASSNSVACDDGERSDAGAQCSWRGLHTPGDWPVDTAVVIGLGHSDPYRPHSQCSNQRAGINTQREIRVIVAAEAFRLQGVLSQLFVDHLKNTIPGFWWGCLLVEMAAFRHNPRRGVSRP